MTHVVVQLIKLQEQIRILHWQTKAYSRHVAYGTAYADLGELLDTLVETYQGKYGRLVFQQNTFDIIDIDNVKISELIDMTIDTLQIELTSLLNSTKDTDLLNIRDEIVGHLNKFKYILTLK
jgi:hypothetical protein